YQTVVAVVLFAGVKIVLMPLWETPCTLPSPKRICMVPAWAAEGVRPAPVHCVWLTPTRMALFRFGVKTLGGAAELASGMLAGQLLTAGVAVPQLASCSAMRTVLEVPSAIRWTAIPAWPKTR